MLSMITMGALGLLLSTIGVALSSSEVIHYDENFTLKIIS